MIDNIKSLFRSADEQPVEFDGRYKAKIKPRKLDLFEKWKKENRETLSKTTKSENRINMKYYEEIFTTDKVLEILKKNRVIGTFCNMVPEELIIAAGCLPVRLDSGCYASISPAEDSFPRDSCPLIKSSFGFVNEPFFKHCEAIVIPATCDGKKKLGELLNEYKPVWMLDLPQSKERQISKDYWFSEVRMLKKRLEDLTGNKITLSDLKSAIELLQKRSLVVRRFLECRKKPVISGTDAFLVMQSAFYADIDEWIKNTKKLCDELEKNIKAKKYIKSSKVKRLLVTGSPILLPNFKLPNIIEKYALIAVDETCGGSQYIYDPVKVDEWTMLEMMKAVSERYLMPSMCPCFIKSEDRIDRLLELVDAYKIDGVIYHTLRLCVLFDAESFKVKSAMEVPFIQINTEYSQEDAGQINTRIEAFVEILDAR